MDRIQAMRTFCAVVEQDGFSAAARHLGVSVAVVSRQVKALEAHLEVQLLQRTTRAVSVTGAGRGYYTFRVKAVTYIAGVAGEPIEGTTYCFPD